MDDDSCRRCEWRDSKLRPRTNERTDGLKSYNEDRNAPLLLLMVMKMVMTDGDGDDDKKVVLIVNVRKRDAAEDQEFNGSSLG